MSASASSFGFVAAMDAVREQLTRGCGLEPIALAPGLAHARAELHGAPITVDARMLRGGPLALARFAAVRGPGVEIASLVCVARTALGLPIFGADLVALGPRRSLVAIDLSPSVPELAEHDLAGLAARRRDAPTLASAGTLPPWCAPLFSPQHVFARPEPEQAPLVHASLFAFADAYAELLDGALPRAGHSDAAATMTRRYLAAHREDDKSRTVLANAFGDAWARDFVEQVLFPETPT